MKPKFRSLIAAFSPATRASLVICASFCAASSVHAASQTWDGDTDVNWSTAANWVGGAVPGSTAPANNNVGQTDIATFNSATALFANVATEDTRFINSVAFSGAAKTYDIAGNLFYVRNGGSISLASDVVNPQTISANVRVRQNSSSNGAYTFTNNSTTSSATLRFTVPTFTLTNANGRPTTLTLNGSNTGENAITGAITNATGGQLVNVINKTGTGTWVLSGANTFTGSGATTAANGIQISDGTLAIENNASLGSNGTANSVQTTVSGTGTLEIRNGLIVDNGVSLNLNNGGTIKAVGTTATNGRINVGTAASTSVTITTVGASDLFTIGNGTNDLNGGAADSVIHVSGPGTVFQNVASAYAGTWSVDSGTLRLGSATALGTLGGVSVAGGANLQTYGNSPTVTSLTGTGTVSNGVAGSSTLTANISGSNTFAGQLQDGVDGALGVTKGGVGILNLSGTSSYTDPTVVGAGQLNVTGQLGDTSVTGASGATLSGNGTITGDVTLDTGVHIAPGDGGNSTIGMLSVGALTLNSGSQLDFDISSTSSLDAMDVTDTDGLVIDGGQLNINGGLSEFTANGVYNLIEYSGSIGGTGVSALSVNGLNKSVTKSYTFGDTGSIVTLTIADSGVSQTFWNVDSNGNWSNNTNWTPTTVPNAVGAFAGFGGGGTEITADRTITVNGSFTVGTLSFNGAANDKSYTLADGGSAVITLDNGANGSFVTDSAGDHSIEAGLSMTNNGATFTVTGASDTLTVSGVIDGFGSTLAKGGDGTLVLSGSNTYDGDTTINGGTVRIDNANSLGDEVGTAILNEATLQVTEDVTSTRAFQLGDFASTISVDSGKTFNCSGFVDDGAVAGTLNKTGDGTLVLNVGNTYSGGTVVNAGTVSISDASSLGNAAGALTLNAATLVTTANISTSRNITLGNAASTIQTEAATTYTVTGTVGGTGNLVKTGDGTLTMSATNTYAGGTMLNAGTLVINGGGALSSGAITALNGTTLSLTTNIGTGSNVVTLSGTNASVTLLSNQASAGYGFNFAGSADQTVVIGSNPTNFNNTTRQFTNFLGTVNVPVGSSLSDRSTSVTWVNGGDSALFHVDGSITSRNGGNWALGGLTGTGTLGMGGAGSSGIGLTYMIGARNDISNTFSGVIQDGDTANAKHVSVTKVGTGIQVLSGINTYSGATTVNAGTLAVENASALGADTTGTTVAGGDVNSKVTIAGDLTLTEPWTLGGRQGTNVDSPSIVSLSGNNTLSGLVTPNTGGDTYSIESSADTLTLAGDFVPAVASMGNRFLQVVGAGAGEWSGSIQNGTATVYVNLKSSGTWTFSGANSYTGDTVVYDTTFILSSTGHLKFAPTSNGVCNLLYVYGAGSATLDGVLDLDLTNTDNTDGNSWQLIDLTSVTFGSNFSLAGFTKSGSTWTMTTGPSTYSFDETTGYLSVATVAGGYANWASTNAGNQDPDADFDNDGVSNGVEYFMNSAAGFTANPGLVSGTVNWPNGGNIDSSEYGSQFVVQTSSDLATWTDVVAPNSNLTNDSNGVSYTPTESAPFFVRLKVTPN